MLILGVSCYYHDAAAVLLRDGVPVAGAEEERFSRIKHDYGYPRQAIQFCLESQGLNGQDLDYVVFYEKPLVKFERLLNTSLATYPASYPVFRESMIAWFNDKLWIKSRLMSELGVPTEKILFTEHHLSHAASAFFCSPYDEAAIVTLDGVGEWTTTAIGQGRADWGGKGKNKGQNSIELSAELRFPHSLGLLYSAFTAFLGFRVNNGEYKVMGMAPYGEPCYMDEIYKLVRVANDGSFELDMDYFSFHRSTSRTFSRKFTNLFGDPRVPESSFYTQRTNPRKDVDGWKDAVAEKNQYYADLAASIQRVTEEVILKIVNHAHTVTGSKRLCMAGGVALNSVANGRIQRETPFEEVYIQPAAGDSGGALGAAQYVYHCVLGNPRHYVMETAYLGKEYDEKEMQTAIQATGFKMEKGKGLEDSARHMADDLVAGKVISLFNGRFEWGPRALGNRSILADPRKASMKETVNARIKFREPFRPFAPVVLEQRAPDFYEDIEKPQDVYPVRFMLMVYKAKEAMRDKIEAVTHEGGTGRIQTIRKEWNPLYYRTVELFGEATGVPIVLNTSFNLRGEPIVNSPAQALNSFSKSDIDRLYMGPFIVSKS